jgi:hypothetical protein
MATKKNVTKKATKKDDVKFIVTVQAGSAVGERLRFPLDADQAKKLTVDAAIRYGMKETNYGRRQEGIVGTIEREMRGQYGITANNEAIKPTATIGQYFTDRTAPDKKTVFRGVDLIVASKQTGGSIDDLANDLYHG